MFFFKQKKVNFICLTQRGGALTSDSTSRMSSPAEGRSFQPTTSTAVLGPASVNVRPFSSNRKRTLAQLLPATSTAPLFSAPRWTRAVVTGLQRKSANEIYRQINKKIEG